MSLPSFFVEIGSTEKEWTDPAAGLAIAQSVLSAVPQDPVPLIGFGGTHYAARETEIALTSRGAFGHIAHTREIATLDETMIKAMMEKSGAVAAYIDRKALNREDLNRLSGMLATTGIPRLSESEILSMGHLPWEQYQCCTGDGRSGLARLPGFISMTCRERAPLLSCRSILSCWVRP